MKKFDKYPPATPEDLARIETMSHKGRVHPLLWIVGAVLIIIGVGVYSDIVGFYEFEEWEEYLEGEKGHAEEDDEEDDEEDEEDDLHPMERQLMESPVDDVVDDMVDDAAIREGEADEAAQSPDPD